MRFLISVIAALLSVSASWAGDAEKLNIVGFSKDASYFAFETYGVGDGSGLGYSDIYVIEVKSNSWVKGTPIRQRGEDENQTQAVARAEARKKVSPILIKYGIDQPFEFLAHNPITEIISDRRRLEFDSIHRSYGNSATTPGAAADNRFILKLEHFPIGGNADCLSESGARHGFSLSVTQTLSGKNLEVYKDTAVPTSRSCPYDYELEAIVSPEDESGSPILIALVAYYSQGFEGPDRKFIAVPFTLP